MRQTLAYLINMTSPVTFNRTGKFEALSSKWTHGAMDMDDYELIVETKGNLYLQVQNEKYTVSPGQYLLLQPLPQKNSNDCSKARRGFRESECSFYWMHFTCPRAFPMDHLMPNMLDGGRNDILVPVHKSLLYPERVLLLMRQLQNCVRFGYDTHYTDYMATLIISEIANQHTLSMLNHKATSTTPTQGQLYSDIVDYINYFINDNLKVSNVANHFGYNEKYLSRYFREISGISLKKYILNQKIEKASFLLSDTNMAVGAIADSLGFSDYHNFARTYKNITSMTPSEYRTMYAKRIINHD